MHVQYLQHVPFEEPAASSAASLVEHCAHDITGGRFQQLPERIRGCERESAAIRPILFSLLDYLVSA
jgi:hypothetical protein